MTILTTNDLAPLIKDTRLTQLLDGQTIALDNAESIAIAEIKDALFSRYQVATIFTNIQQYPQVKHWLAVIILYYLHRRLPDQIVPPSVIRDYDEVKETLVAIADAKRSVNLPHIAPDQDGKPSTKFRWGSNAPRTH
jgi:hypothetical protein